MARWHAPERHRSDSSGRGPRPERSAAVPGIPVDALLQATVSVPWERPVHEARLAFLRRVARPGQVSVHVACGLDRLGFIDVACGLTTVLTDVDAAALDVLTHQFTELQTRFGPLAGSLRCCQIPVEAFAREDGFPPGSVHHLTLQNLFNAHLHSPAAYPRLMDILLTVMAPGGSFFLTASEAEVLLRQARARTMPLLRLGEIQGYYDEPVVMARIATALP